MIRTEDEEGAAQAAPEGREGWLALISLWSDAGQSEDRFWQQTPASFRAVLDGVRKRLERERESSLRHAWETAAFTTAGQSKDGLKPLDHYLSRTRPGGKATPQQMLDVLRDAAGRGMPMTIRKVS